MSRLAKNTLGAILALLVLALPGQAMGFDAGVRTPLLANPTPGAISVPFEIPIRQSSAVPQPLDFQIAVEGFKLDPEPVADRRIGSLDMVTDSGDFDDTAILSNGPGTDGVRTWTLVWGLAKPIVAQIEDGVGLSDAGLPEPKPGFTLISFTMPGNYHGFRMMGLSLRFNQEDGGRPTEGTGAVNPTLPGRYSVKSRIKSDSPAGETKLSTAYVRVSDSPPKTALKVSADRSRARVGQRVRFTLRTTNGTRDRVSVMLNRRRLGTVQAGPDPRSFSWRPTRAQRGKRVVLVFIPERGPARRVLLKVAR